MQAQRSELRGERWSDGVSVLPALAKSEGYAARDDEGLGMPPTSIFTGPAGYIKHQVWPQLELLAKTCILTTPAKLILYISNQYCVFNDTMI